jgi:hypothetical protein
VVKKLVPCGPYVLAQFVSLSKRVKPGGPMTRPAAPGQRSPLTTYVPGLCVLPGRRDTPDTWTGHWPESQCVAAAEYILVELAIRRNDQC